MGSSGKKKTTMAKLDRENRLRERRRNKQAKKDARRQASTDQPNGPDNGVEPADALATSAPADHAGDGSEGPGPEGEAERVFRQVEPSLPDPRSKEVALARLREASDRELAVFEGTLRDDAVEAGASEHELRQAQRAHPEHGA